MTFTYSANLSDDYEEEEDTSTDSDSGGSSGVTKPGGDSYVPEIWSTSSTVYPTSVQQYKYTNSWGDQLTSYNGSSISYDSYGNPTTYLGGTMSWTRGRLLNNYTPSGKWIKTFGYDVNGMRISKTSVSDDGYDTLYTDYIVDGTNILGETRQIRRYGYTGAINEIVYMYTHNGLVGLTYNGAQYRYVKNIQGDIIAILDSSNDVVAKYIYDAWGNHAVCDASGSNISSSTHIANINPFRYRGYYYDTDLDLYYLQSRYYDPNTGRFINADTIDYLDPESINGLNLYAYCLNNPIMYCDPTGHEVKWWQWALAGVGAALVVAACVVLTVGTAGLGGGLVAAVAVGAAKGALIGAAVGTAVGAAGGAIYAGVTGADMGDSILSGAMIGFGAGAIIGAVIGGAVGGINYGSFASKSTLNSHFAKHGTNMGYSSTKSYANGAKYVIKNGEKVTYMYKGKTTTGYLRFLGQGGKANYAFVGMNGSKTATFGIRSVNELIRLGISFLA